VMNKGNCKTDAVALRSAKTVIIKGGKHRWALYLPFVL
jgi:hypothetical protein